MNRFDLEFESVESTPHEVPHFERQSSAPPVLEMPTACRLDVLMTRRHKPITTIRRLRFHRSSWPKKS
jgi:hypothetical protein